MNKKMALLLALASVLGAAALVRHLDRSGSKSAMPPALSGETAALDVGITLPLDLRLTPLAEVAPGKVVPVQLEYALQIPRARVTVKIEWPRTAQLVSGISEWRGEMRQGEPLKLDFALQLAGADAGYLIAQAEVIPPGGKAFSQGTSLYLDPQRRMEAAQETKPVPGYAGASQIRVHRPAPEQKE